MTMNFADVLPFMTGIGLGSILGAFIKYILEKKDKQNNIWIKEYKEAADGLLEAYMNAALNPNDNNAQKSFARWEVRLQLLASGNVIREIENLKKSNPKSEDRFHAHQNLIKNMRQDLGISKYKS